MYQKACYKDHNYLGTAIKKALGSEKADLAIKNISILDVFTGAFRKGDVAVHGEHIVGTFERYDGKKEIQGDQLYLVPGFIDSHVHIESSLMTPSGYEQSVLKLGTTTAIWDPHEIANVKGVDGIRWAIEASEHLLIDLFIMLPSCVPSTPENVGLESGGAQIFAKDLEAFATHPRVLGLAEMMNYPGLLGGDKDVHDKLLMFKNNPRDGHCPGLSGYSLNGYATAGIHSCHESVSKEEAFEKLSKGIHTLVREGSCAKNAHTLLPLINSYTSSVMALCSDDRNPADIFHEGHINYIVNLGLKLGLNPEDIFRVSSFGPAQMYGLKDRGAIAPGYLADFCLIKKRTEHWKDGFDICHVVKSGQIVTDYTPKQLESKTSGQKNIQTSEIKKNSFQIQAPKHWKESTINTHIIGAQENQIVTLAKSAKLEISENLVQPNAEQDILKIAVIERHQASGNIGLGFVHGFNINCGAIATSINHDSHNIIVVGSDDESMFHAVQKLQEIDGGIVVWKDEKTVEALPLPIGGLMTSAAPDHIASRLDKLKILAKATGCRFHEPFLQLSFLALPVIPNIKITDKGLVDVNQFKVISLFVGDENN